MKNDANVAGGWVRRSAKKTAVRGCVLLVLLAAGCVAAWAAPLPFLPTIGLQLAMLGGISLVERWLLPVIEKKARGASAEERVGEILDGVDGWVAIHDIDTGRGNIDHVVIGPGGVFTVETKSWPGRRFDPAEADARWWSQAYAQSKHAETLLGRRVEPLLVVVGPYTKHLVEPRKGVLVMSHRVLAGHLARRSHVLDPGEVAVLRARLAGGLSQAA